MASRSAVMISGERSANWASSFLRSAGASWAAATLRWMTRPARSSRTAGSGMPATTALTAAVSTGLLPRTSSREATAWCNRHGTKAAAAMQANTAPARSGDNSPNATSTARARPATNRMMAEWRSRSGHGEKKEGEEGGASTAIWTASPLVSPSGGRIATLPHIGGFARRSRRIQTQAGGVAQAFRPGGEDNLPKRQQDYRYDKRRNIIEQAEQHHTCQQVFSVHLPEADQHGGVEHPEPPRRMAGKAE